MNEINERLALLIETNRWAVDDATKIAEQREPGGLFTYSLLPYLRIRLVCDIAEALIAEREWSESVH